MYLYIFLWLPRRHRNFICRYSQIAGYKFVNQYYSTLCLMMIIFDNPTKIPVGGSKIFGVQYFS